MQRINGSNIRLPPRRPAVLTTGQSLLLLALEMKAKMTPCSWLRDVSKIENLQRPTEAYLSILPVEIIDTIFKYAVVYDDPVSLDVFFEPAGFGRIIDLRFLLHSDNYEYWAVVCLQYALEQNEFVFYPNGENIDLAAYRKSEEYLPEEILQFWKALMKANTFQKHNPYFEFIRHIQIPLPLSGWSGETWVQKEVAWATYWENSLAIISGVLHRFSRIETLDFEYAYIWVPDIQPDKSNEATTYLGEEPLDITPVDPSLREALVRSGIRIAEDQNPGESRVTCSLYRLKVAPKEDGTWTHEDDHGGADFKNYVSKLLKHHDSSRDLRDKTGWDLLEIWG